MNRRKMIGLVLSLLAAAVGTLAILKYAKGSQSTAAAPTEPMVTVLQVTQAIPKGTPAASLASYTKAVQVPQSASQPNAASSVDQLTAMVANTDLIPGEFVSTLRFSPAETVAAQTAAGTTDDYLEKNGLIGVWITLDSIKALNGHVVPGKTKVAVFADFQVKPPTGEAVSQEHLILHHVPVLDVWPPVGVATSAVVATDASAPATTVAPVVPATVTLKLAVDAPAAERLIYAQLHGTVYLGEEPDTAPKDAPTKIVKIDNVFSDTAAVAAVKPAGAAAATDAAAGATTTIKPVATANGASSAAGAASAANAAAGTTARSATGVNRTTTNTVAATATP